MRKLTTCLCVAALAGACGDDGSPNQPDASIQPDSPPSPDAPPDSAPLTGSCTTDITPANAAGGAFVELCSIPNGHGVKHVTIAGLQLPPQHMSAQVFFGFDAAPSSYDVELEADQARFQLYAGGSAGPAGTLPPQVELDVGDATSFLAGDASFVTASSTVCFDLHDGSATTAPYFVLWVDGQKGASCADPATLTLASAFGTRALYHGGTGALDKTTKVYYRQGGAVTSMPTITLSDTPAQTEAAILAAAQCSSTFAANTNWQETCAPAAGSARHVRVNGIAATANSSYFYAIHGQDAPTDLASSPATTAGDQSLILLAGRHYNATSATYFKFNGGQVLDGAGPFQYQTDTPEPLYTPGPTTICYDLGTIDELGATYGNLRILLWATGANGADCADRSTLTYANVLYDSTTDTANAAVWNAALTAGKPVFVKVNNATITLTDVQVSSEPAVLDTLASPEP